MIQQQLDMLPDKCYNIIRKKQIGGTNYGRLRKKIYCVV